MTSGNKKIGHKKKIENDKICIVDEVGLGLSRNNEETVDVNVNGEEDMNNEFSKQDSLEMILMESPSKNEIYFYEQNSFHYNQNNQHTQPSDSTTLNGSTCNRLGEGILEYYG